MPELDIDLALMLALLLTLGLFCQWVSWRMRLPAILLLLLTGIVLGPGLGLLDPDAVMGDLLFPFVSLGVAIILFEGSLTLRFSDVRSHAGIIRNLVTVGAAVTWAVMTAAAHFLVGFDWGMALLFGALVTVTGPTVIVPMLRSIRTTPRVANILRWEGILIDPIGAVLAVIMFEFLVTGHEQESLIEFGRVVLMGSVFGVAGGAVMGQIFKRHLFPEYLKNYAALSFVLLVFTTSNAFGHESGLIAVTVMGIMMANMKGLDTDELLSFKEHLTVVLISLLFILLAARLRPEMVIDIGMPALLVLGVALFVARPLSVLLSSIGTNVTAREIALLSWVAPRGIVAAAISSLFALRLEQAGVAGAEKIVPLTFVIIIGTVVIHSLTAGWLAKRLGLSSRGEQGTLIYGSNKVALTLASVLKENGLNVKVVDAHRRGISEARLQGLDVFFGHPLSDHADRYMDISGYTHMLALSRNAEANAVVCRRYRHEFGPTKVFMVQSGSDEEDEREGLSHTLRGRMLFRRGATWAKLASLIAQGARTRSTDLTEEFDFEAYQGTHTKDALHLFALNPQGRLRVFYDGAEFVPGPGWTVISLVSADPPADGVAKPD